MLGKGLYLVSGFGARNTMARKKVTTDLILKYLGQQGWETHEVLDAGEQGLVWSEFRSAGDVFTLFIEPKVEKNLVGFMVPEVARAPMDETPSDRLRDLLLVMAMFNLPLELGAFAYHDDEGHVVFKFAIPVASNDLRSEDFKLCLEHVTGSIDAYAALLRQIIDGTVTAQDFVG